jgi:biotin carboxylase
MAQERPITILCLASFFKGKDFMRQAKREGASVLLLTRDALANEEWPHESIDEIFMMPDLSNLQHVTNTVSYLCRGRVIDQIIPLDEYDVETIAALREHLRLPGIGQTQMRFFRDKLAMRQRAHANGIRVPEFTPIFNYDKVREFFERVPLPYILKPRTEAGTIGLRKIYEHEQLWRTLDELGDRQSGFLLEEFIPGSVYHVDTITVKGKPIFASAQKYGMPPFNVSHEGGIFTTRILDRESDDAKALLAMNTELLQKLGMVDGVTHAEFIKGDADGQFYFLEVAARVGGANIADLVEAATGLNLWAEWARLEIAQLRGEKYKLPKLREDYAGLLNSLARQQWPDTSAYNDPEVVWRANKEYHVGMIVASPDASRVQALLDDYSQRFVSDFMAVAPPQDKALH